MYDMQRTSTLGIAKFSGTGELKFKHLYDVGERQRPRVNKVEQMALSNFRRDASAGSEKGFSPESRLDIKSQGSVGVQNAMHSVMR